MENWNDMVARYPYEVVVRDGCHSRTQAPVVSRHRTLRSAVAKARKSDRWQVESSRRSGAIWAIPAEGRVIEGRGYGRHDSSLAECLEQAERNI